MLRQALWLTLTLALASPALAATAPPKLSSKANAALLNQAQAPLLLRFAQGVDFKALTSSKRGDDRLLAVVAALQSQAAHSQRSVRDLLDRRGANYQAYWVANFIRVEADAELARELAAHKDILAIELDQKLVLDALVAVGSADAQKAIEPGVSLINAPGVWAMGFSGQGVIVAGQDTGYRWDHPALRDSYLGWNGSSVNHDYAWFDGIRGSGGSAGCAAASPTPCDDNGHGTHTMGTVLGDDGAGNQVGVAPGARWMACRNMDLGNGTPSTYAACFQFFLAPTDVNGNNPDPLRAPHVINNSWGCPPSEGCTDVNVLRDAVEAVKAAGILVVASAGNSGSGCSTIVDPPAIYAASFVVGASSGNSMASFSSRGPVTAAGANPQKPDVVAPGSGVRSSTRDGAYGFMSGTSMAGPHVAGAAALLMSVDPSLKRNPEAVEALLRSSAVPISSSQTCGAVAPTTIPNFVFGHGRIDVQAAMRNGMGVLAINGFE